MFFNEQPGSIVIGKRKYDVIDCEMNQADLLFYIDNPRVYSVLRTFDDQAPSQTEIQEYMCNQEHVKQLKLSIKENGGLIDPLIVRDGDYVVLEGNSRLAAYRLLCNADPIQWGRVRCKVLPKDIDDSAVFTLLGQYHIVGRKDWMPYEQAGYLYRRHMETKIPIESIAKELGITAGKARDYINVFSYMKEKNDLNQDKWSYYEEFLKSTAIRNALKDNPELENRVVEQIQNDEIITAADIRKLAKIAGDKTKKSKQILKKYAEGDQNLYDSYEEVVATGSLDRFFEKITEIRNIFIAADFKNKVETNQKKSDIVYMLKKIRKVITGIVGKEKDDD